MINTEDDETLFQVIQDYLKNKHKNNGLKRVTLHVSKRATLKILLFASIFTHISLSFTNHLISCNHS